MKTCASCNISKSKEDFPIKKSTFDGLYSYCKECKKKKERESYLINKEKKLAAAKKYYNKNKHKILLKREQNKEAYNKYNREWHRKNRGRALERMRNWRKENHSYRQEYKKIYRSLNKEKTKETYKNWLQNNPVAKISKSCRNRISEIIKNKNLQKTKHFNEYIGCSASALSEHIQNQFKEGMSWENYGEWHVDHIVPLSAASTEEQVYKLNHYTNLAPVWAHENISKNNSLVYTVKPITIEETKPYILDIHYARRMPVVKYAFGLFANDLLVGVITYGPTASPNTAKALVGEEHKHRVLELNRLCLKNNLKNEASILVSRSLKLLPKGMIILSFADSDKQHVGYVYQATNFKYYGTTKPKGEVALKSAPNRHSLTIFDESKGQEDRIGYLRNQYGDDLYYRRRSKKHRYVYITGNNKNKYAVIKYEELPYPKHV